MRYSAHVHQGRSIRRYPKTGAKSIPVPYAKPLDFNSCWSDFHLRLDTIVAQHLQHRSGWHYNAMNIIALGFGESSGDKTQP